MHTHPAAGARRRLSFVIVVAGYVVAWMMVAPVLASLAQRGLIARHHLDAYPNYHLRYPPYTTAPKVAVDTVLPLAGRAGDRRRSPDIVQECEPRHASREFVQRRAACRMQAGL